MTIGSKTQLTPPTPVAEVVGAMPNKRPGILSDVSVKVSTAVTSAAEGVDSAVEADITREDALGEMFAKAFGLPAPDLGEIRKGLEATC